MRKSRDIDTCTRGRTHDHMTLGGLFCDLLMVDTSMLEMITPADSSSLASTWGPIPLGGPIKIEPYRRELVICRGKTNGAISARIMTVNSFVSIVVRCGSTFGFLALLVLFLAFLILICFVLTTKVRVHGIHFVRQRGKSL